MKTLLLTSAGMNIKDEILKILPRPVKTLKLAHVITAAKPELNTEYARKDKQRLIDFGFNVEDVDIEGKNACNLKRLFQDKDVIFVQGGNTFYLLKQAKLSGFDQVVKEMVNQEKIYIGVSAGTYIACPTIEQATWKYQDRNSVGLTDFSALNLVPFIIFAHFKEEHRLIVNQAVKTTKYPVIALYDTQAVLVQGDHWKVVGQGKREFFNGLEES